jgi:hypothetical protein
MKANGREGLCDARMYLYLSGLLDMIDGCGIGFCFGALG